MSSNTLPISIPILKTISDIKNIFYINLDTRTDRKKSFEQQIKLLGLNATRVNAIRNKHPAVGCSLSHLQILNHAKENNMDHVLIMEDDILFLNPSEFIKNLNYTLQNHNDFDVLLFAANNVGNYSKLSDSCVKITCCQTTTGYLVKNHYYDVLINNFKKGILNLMKNIHLPNMYAIDSYWKQLQPIHKWYLIIPLTVTQCSNYSDIEGKNVNYDYLMLSLDKKEIPYLNICQTN